MMSHHLDVRKERDLLGVGAVSEREDDELPRFSCSAALRSLGVEMRWL